MSFHLVCKSRYAQVLEYELLVVFHRIVVFAHASDILSLWIALAAAVTVRGIAVYLRYVGVLQL